MDYQILDLYNKSYFLFAHRLIQKPCEENQFTKKINDIVLKVFESKEKV